MTIGKILVLCGTSIVIVALLAFASSLAYVSVTTPIWATPFGVVFLGAMMILAGTFFEAK